MPPGVIDFVYKEVELISDTLERKLGIWSVVIISLSAMLGSGLFVLPALAMLDLGGPGVWLAYVFAALVVLPGAISKAELGTAMPTSGGDYIYIERTYGPLFGTVAGLGLWASFLLKAAFALIGFSAYLWIIESLLGITFNAKFAALVLLVIVVAINVIGVRLIKKVQTVVIAISVLFLVSLCIWAALTADPDWMRPIGAGAFGDGWTSMAETAAFVFVSYAGVTKIAAVAEEVKLPGKNLPRGILFSLFISTILYAGIVYMMMAAVEPSAYVSNGEAREDPMFVFANSVGGPVIGITASVLAILTMTSMALAGILAASRYPFAMARDNLLPEALEDVNPKFETPHWSVIGTGLAMAVVIIFLPDHDVAKLASGFQIMIFIIVNSCVLVLRRASEAHSWYKPVFKSPFYPLTQILGIAGGVLLIYMMGEKALVGAAACTALGLVVYFSYGRARAHPMLTPWRTVRTELTNPEQSEREKRWMVFHSCGHHRRPRRESKLHDWWDKNHPDHLTLHELIQAMNILVPDLEHFHLRNLFHEVDIDGNGVIDIDEFLISFENGTVDDSEE